jgi:hypothetical protein
VHTVFKNGSWTNTVEGGDGGTATHGSKEAAVAAGRQLAQSNASEHLIHNQDGVIAERNSYGNDPADRPG